MLVYGSRAIRFHIPAFREPKDWDLVGNNEDYERLKPLLAPGPQRIKRLVDLGHKTHFMYGKALVEFVFRERWAYWDHIAEIFKDEPILEEPVLGEMRVPPISFLMMTKHCALIYPIIHWYKNLEDFYLLKSYVPEVDPRIAPLLSDTHQNGKDVYGEFHDTLPHRPHACHPKLPRHPRQDWHAMLHDRMKLGAEPVVSKEGAWQAFPAVGEPEKTELMIRLFAEEVLVLMGHLHMETDQNAEQKPVSQLARAALRMLITGHLPAAWRYFGVNHYRQIESIVPADFYDRVRDMNHLRPSSPEACSSIAGDFNEVCADDAG